MKPFKINRKSWHYKFNQYFFNDWYNDGGENAMIMQWEPRHNNFCAYWRATMFRLIFAGVLSIVSVSFASVFAAIIYAHPVQVAIAVGSVVGAVALIFGIVAAKIWYDTNKTKKPDAQESLFVQKYHAYKSKVCPMVEYEE